MKTPSVQLEHAGTTSFRGNGSGVAERGGGAEVRQQVEVPHATGSMERVAEWLVLFVACGFLFTHTLPRAWKTLNTDFPNYYLAAQLQREGFDMSRAYEWRWLARQKDHHALDRPLVALVPITPFSTLAVRPLTKLPPLAAKHIWTLLQLALLLPIALALRRISGEPYRRIALLIAVCYPLHRNLEYGQYYILLLAMMVGACLAYQRGRHALAGTLIALAAATKIFPILFLLYFLRRKSWRAVGGAMVAAGGVALISIGFFGWSMHRTYLNLVLPWTLRGEVLPPYALSSNSISSLLHLLFVYEPQWNPHPWHAIPALAAVLQPLLQMLVLAPALLLVEPDVVDAKRIALEWSALLTATLATSTVPASYNFTLLILPVVVLYGYLRGRHRVASLAVLVLFLGIGYPSWKTSSVDGLRAVLHVPRLALLLLFTAALYWVLHRSRRNSLFQRTNTVLWLPALATLCVFSMVTGLRHQRGLFADYAYRLPESRDVLMASTPAMADRSVAAAAMLPDGYKVIGLPASASSTGDELSFAASPSGSWMEQAGHTSRLISSNSPGEPAIEEAQQPSLSQDGQHLAYLRDIKGHSRLYVRAIGSPGASEVAWTPAWMNVEEAVFLPDASLVVAAQEHGGSQFYRFQIPMHGLPMKLGDARYPAASPDGHWLAYSVFSSGAWNLWLLDRVTGKKQRITDAACNHIEPSWESDSKTLLYASDCGRALWFTVICRRRVVS